MNKVIIIPDSFKGTLSAEEVCDIVSDVILDHYPDCSVSKVPVADGGEGTIDAFLYGMDGEKVRVTVEGPYGSPVDADYALIDDGSTALVEMAACSGLTLVGERKDPSLTTTFGVGEIIKDALDRKVRKIILGIGGSATNDGGCGMASALGVRFTDVDGREFIPVGGTLRNIEGIDVSFLDKRLNHTDITVMCDVTNPLCGAKGASMVFGPQKGADCHMVKKLDAGLAHYADRIEAILGKKIRDIPGAGAAGGIGAGIITFLDAQLDSGINTMLKTLGFNDMVKDADMVFTGEGRVDSQSNDGKVISGVSAICKAADVPLFVFTGSVIDPVPELYKNGVTAIFSIIRELDSTENVMIRAKENLRYTVDSALRLIKSISCRSSEQ